MRVIGIDPGSNITGYGVLEGSNGVMRHIDNGTVAPRSKLPFHERLSYIYENLERLIGEYRPDAIAIENVFVAKNARSSLLLGHARGIAMLAASRSGVEIEEYTPSEIKVAVTGSGRASKEQMQCMVQAVLKLPEVACEDASDALAVAICHISSAGLRAALARASNGRSNPREIR
jgi:crossover junction endodeoxyribonuclease RuvC